MLIGIKKSSENSLTKFTTIPVITVKAEFSKSVNMMSRGRNSTLQPILDSAEGGFLNLKEFQFVDYKFSK